MKRFPYLVLMTLTLLFIQQCAKKETPQQLWEKAKDLHSREEYLQSIETYERLVKEYPGDKLAPESIFLIADIYTNNLKDYEGAIDSYRRVVEKYPESEFAPKSQFMIGYIYGNYANQYDKAREEYQAFLDRYPKHELAKDVEFEIKNLGKDLDEIETLKFITAPESERE